MYTDMVTSSSRLKAIYTYRERGWDKSLEMKKINFSNSYLFFSTFVLNIWRQQEQGGRYSHPAVSIENLL